MRSFYLVPAVLVMFGLTGEAEALGAGHRHGHGYSAGYAGHGRSICSKHGYAACDCTQGYSGCQSGHCGNAWAGYRGHSGYRAHAWGSWRSRRAMLTQATSYCGGGHGLGGHGHGSYGYGGYSAYGGHGYGMVQDSCGCGVSGTVVTEPTTPAAPESAPLPVVPAPAPTPAPAI